jgi:hypothetical protein
MTMSKRPFPSPKPGQAKRSKWKVDNSRSRSSGSLPGKRGRHGNKDRPPFIPPEDWHEPDSVTKLNARDFRIVVQPPGDGYRHAVTADDIRGRLALLPDALLEPLEIVQLSRMTRKKQTYPCYGMQWGQALYLYPIEISLIETFGRPPRPAEKLDAQMYGGKWRQTGTIWHLIWTPTTIRDYYLNNVLIHELGHLLDHRNSSYADRERYAEWFAIQHGYKASRRANLAHRAAQKMSRRHGGR